MPDDVVALVWDGLAVAPVREDNQEILGRIEALLKNAE